MAGYQNLFFRFYGVLKPSPGLVGGRLSKPFWRLYGVLKPLPWLVVGRQSKSFWRFYGVLKPSPRLVEYDFMGLIRGGIRFTRSEPVQMIVLYIGT
jgi:hypothetical protein